MKNSKDVNLKAYCDLMLEIKHRAISIAKLERPNRELMADFVRVEFLVLQIRKILELIALGSMVANESAYKAAYEAMDQHSHADRILRDLEKVNPDFYPRPANYSKSKQKGVDFHLEFVDSEKKSYLNKNEFVKVYKKCGGLLHAQNPFGSNRDYAYYENNVPIWMKKIESLLKIHVIRLVDDENYYLINVNGKALEPQGYTLAPNTPNI